MTRNRAIRIVGLAILVLVAVTVKFVGVGKILDTFDSRPPVRILFVGNSHTYYNDMPVMVRRIADSAGVTQRYDITMHAPGGAEFKDHWASDDLQTLLKQRWDHVILQGASTETLHESKLSAFLDYGERLTKSVAATGGKAWLYVTWRRDPGNDWIEENPHFNRAMHGLVQAGYRRLSLATGAPLINVGKVWNVVETSRPGFTLYDPDGNHASIHGSFLAALMMFKTISELPAEATTYRPDGVSEDEAAYLRIMVDGARPAPTALAASGQ